MTVPFLLPNPLHPLQSSSDHCMVWVFGPETDNVHNVIQYLIETDNIVSGF